MSLAITEVELRGIYRRTLIRPEVIIRPQTMQKIWALAEKEEEKEEGKRT